MKIADMPPSTLLYVGEGDRMLSRDVAVVVDVEEEWSVSKGSRARGPELARPTPRGQRPARARQVPVVYYSAPVNGLGETREDAETVRLALSAAADHARSIMHVGTTYSMIQDEVSAFSLLDDRIEGSARFAFTTPRAIEHTWSDELRRREAQATRRDEQRGRELAAHEVEQAAHDRIAPLVQAAFEVEAGTLAVEQVPEAGLDFGRAYNVSSPRVYSDGSHTAKPVTLSWSQLAAIVDEAKRQGAERATDLAAVAEGARGTQP